MAKLTKKDFLYFNPFFNGYLKKENKKLFAYTDNFYRLNGNYQNSNKYIYNSIKSNNGYKYCYQIELYKLANI